ncbi:MAG: hypothetical protein EVA26_07820 [Burkholderiaceae bacterium]|nr:MAG: hypothetical protein EVA26_07820 [Burkholderiaceae bacterium]
MTGWRFAVRDFINRQLENDEPFLAHTKMLSGKRIIVLMPDILPALMWLEIEIGTDGLVDDIVITDKKTEQSEGVLRIIVPKKYIVSRMRKVASDFLSPNENVSGRSSLFGQGLKIEGDVDDIQTVGDIVEGLVDRATRKYNDVKIFKDNLTKSTNWFFGDFIVRKKDFEQQSRTLNEITERLKNLEKELKAPR